MSVGTLFLIVGPSGVGKDTLLDGVRGLLHDNRWFHFPRRIITRPADAGGEDYVAVTEPEFDDLLTSEKLMHHWAAHGLRYGIPASVHERLNEGVNVVLNTSRNEIVAFRALHSEVVVIHISASPDVIEARLRKRGRESDDEISARLTRVADDPRLDKKALELLNDLTPEAGVSKLIDLIAGSCGLRARAEEFPADFGSRPMCLIHAKNPIATRLLSGSERVLLTMGSKSVVADLGHTEDDRLLAVDACALSKSALTTLCAKKGDVVEVERSPSPKSRGVLQKKIRGGSLDADEMDTFVHDLVGGRFSTSEISGFLVAASKNLTLDEVIALTRVRAKFAHRQRWDADIVVDKHSMGGIPGNRITPIIIPIIAAYGLLIPKTSSRAITSAAGTADMMEVLARVDLTPQDMKRVVEKTSACIAWNGRLTHSPVDDVMNAINRPLGLSSQLLDVSSIMSKKLAAGSTHVLIDMPVGPQAKTKTLEDAEALARLYVEVGEGVGLKVKVNIADGTRPVGHGIGPVLETEDVLKVLRAESDAPRDLLEKAISYSAMLIEWAGQSPADDPRAIAMDLVSSGRAYEKLLQIVEGQGARAEIAKPGTFQYTLHAAESGTLSGIDIRRVADIARSAGAPRDISAGVKLLSEIGQTVGVNDELCRVFSSSQRGLDEAIALINIESSIFKIH